MKHRTVKGLVATAALGVAFPFITNAAPANGPQFRVGATPTTTQAIANTGSRVATSQPPVHRSYPRFRVPYPGQTSANEADPSASLLPNAYAANTPREPGTHTWLR